MRIVYMVPGFTPADAIILKKFEQYGLDTYLIYTRGEPADLKLFPTVKPVWINLDRHRSLPKLLRWTIFGYEVISAVRSINPDIILSQVIQTQGLLSVLSGVRPIVLMPWGSDWTIALQKGKWMRLVSRYVVNHADLIQIDCEAGKNVILQLSRGTIEPEDIWVFPQGIELDIFKPNRLRRQLLRERLGWINNKIVIVTRQLKPVYGIDIFLKAVSKIISQDDTVRGIVVGDGPLENDLRKLAFSLGLADYLIFTGRLDRGHLVEYLNAADIYVSTSHSDGTSLSLLEAMAMGLPAVVTDVPANLEWVEDGQNGFIARRGSVEDVANALLRLVTHSALWQPFGDRSSRLVKEKGDWDKNFEKFVQMFELLLQNKSAALASRKHNGRSSRVWIENNT